MHPPPFRLDHRLSDWPDCHLELRCAPCHGRSVFYPIKLLIKRHGDRVFSAILQKLVCSRCKRRPQAVFLCASPHRFGGHGGPLPDWAIELIPENGNISSHGYR
jgi:hypothetical protein